MGKNYIITEEQYNLIKEELKLPLDIDGANGSVDQAAKNAVADAEKYGLKRQDVTFELPAEKLGENKVISIKQLKESRLKMLKENSQFYTYKDFIKKLK